MYWVVHPRRPRDFPRPERCPVGAAWGTYRGPEGNLKVGGDVQPNTSRLEAVYDHSLIINPYQGVYQEIHPCRAVSIGSVKINTSLLMMREWVAHPLRPQDFPRPSSCPSGFALGTSLGPREISWSLGMYNPIRPSSRECTLYRYNTWRSMFGCLLCTQLRC